ncbi:Mobile element protein [Microcystis aeruginosa NIES-98]|nr:Mobile element protein [Microcystis aeruginosa NIES-98]
MNTVECTIREGSYRFSKITRPTQLQQKALDLLLNFPHTYIL